MAQPFNEVEMMVLSRIAYYKAPGKYSKDGMAIEPCSLFDMANKNKSKLEKEFDKEVVDSFLNKVKNGDYTVIKAVDNTYDSGFEAIAVEGPDKGTVTVAARGSEAKNKVDFVQDWLVADFFGLGTQNESFQQADMDKFMKSLGGYDSIYLTGHSLGGNLATSGAVGFRDQSKIKGVYTFNAPGQNAGYYEKNAYKIANIEDKVTNYVTEDDYVSDVNTPVGKTVVIKSNGKNKTPLFGDHYLSNFTVAGSGFIISKTGKKPQHRIINNTVDKTTTKLSSKKNAKGTYDFIYIKPDAVLEESNKMKLFQQEYDRVVQKMSNLIISLKKDNIWDAPATDSLINSYLDIKVLFDKFSKTMLEYSAVLDGVAQRMREVDNSMSAKFNNLSI